MIRKAIIAHLFMLLLVACDGKTATPQAEQSASIAAQNTAPPEQRQPSTSPQTAERDFMGPQAFIEGQHYQRLPEAVPKVDPTKDEVVEVFWYGCIHCFHFEPDVKAWERSKPENVAFVRVPAVWNDTLVLHARMYYAAKHMDLLEKMNDKIFNAMNVENKRFQTKSEIADFFVANGVDREQFLDMFNSFTVNTDIANARRKTQQYKISGTPEVIVNGRYRTSASMAGSQQNVFKVVDYLLGLPE